MALGSCSFNPTRLTSLPFPSKNALKTAKNPLYMSTASFKLLCVRASAWNSASKARFVARRKESVSVRQLKRPLIEYMRLPASQYSVLDAERIERIDDNTFRCYIYRFKFFNFEVCPVLLVRVEEQPNGCCIKLLSCKLDGSPIVVAQNDKFDACMVNQISCDTNRSGSLVQELTSDAVIEVSIEVPFAFRPIPLGMIESTGTQVLEQILRLMLPRFMAQIKLYGLVSCKWCCTSPESCLSGHISSEKIKEVRDKLQMGRRILHARARERQTAKNGGCSRGEEQEKQLSSTYLLDEYYQAWASGDASRQPLGTGEI
ncbi:Protein of unknown function DUF1997 - like 1 [Theobroma cacao]|nr:Protein of unknown function DUF1997 - like 1 [Theobroma cacao]